MRNPFKQHSAERLAIKLAGRNLSAFARDWNIPGGTQMIYQHIKGLKPIGIKSALAYARALGISLYEITPDLAEQLRNVRIFPDTGEQRDVGDCFPVPYGRFKVHAGAPGHEFECQLSSHGWFQFDETLARERGLKIANLYAIPVDGREMEPYLAVGSTVIVNTADVRRKDGGVFAINRAGRVVIRRLVKRGGSYMLCCDNADLRGEHDVRFDERCRVIGRVIYHYGEVP